MLAIRHGMDKVRTGCALEYATDKQIRQVISEGNAREARGEKSPGSEGRKAICDTGHLGKKGEALSCL